MSSAEVKYVSQDGARCAIRQLASHKIKPGLDRLLLVMIGPHADADGLLYRSQERLAEGDAKIVRTQYPDTQKPSLALRFTAEGYLLVSRPEGRA
jgi:hypothetical protein